MKELLIIGGISTALEIHEALQFGGKPVFEKITFVVGNNEPILNGVHAIRDNEVEAYSKGRDLAYIVSLSDDVLRLKLINNLENFGIKPTNVIHPNALISPTAKLGNGNYIAAGVVISSNAIIGNHCILNFNSVVGHDVVINNHVMVNPGAKISGNAVLEDGVLIGANSVVFQGIQVGAYTKVDALTYIFKNIEPNSICSGSRDLKVFKGIKRRP